MTRMMRLKDEAEYRELLLARSQKCGGAVVNTDQRAGRMPGDEAGLPADDASRTQPSPPSTPDAANGNAADVAGETSSLPDHGASSGTYVLVLPLPPSVNALYRPGEKHGALFLRSEQKEFRAECKAVLRRLAYPQLAGRLEMRIVLYFANRRRSDLDNRIKALWDGCQHAGLYFDDSQIDVLWVERVVRPGAAEECVVHVREIPGAT